MNLVLIGYRGTGKSTIATLLGDRLGMEVVSLDQEIVLEAGRAIPAIVAEHGWPYFRDLEASVTQRVSQRDDIIIDSGGGVILRDDNVARVDPLCGPKRIWNERDPVAACASASSSDVTRSRCPMGACRSVDGATVATTASSSSTAFTTASSPASTRPALRARTGAESSAIDSAPAPRPT